MGVGSAAPQGSRHNRYHYRAAYTSACNPVESQPALCLLSRAYCCRLVYICMCVRVHVWILVVIAASATSTACHSQLLLVLVSAFAAVSRTISPNSFWSVIIFVVVVLVFTLSSARVLNQIDSGRRRQHTHYQYSPVVPDVINAVPRGSQAHERVLADRLAACAPRTLGNIWWPQIKLSIHSYHTTLHSTTAHSHRVWSVLESHAEFRIGCWRAERRSC